MSETLPDSPIVRPETADQDERENELGHEHEREQVPEQGLPGTAPTTAREVGPETGPVLALEAASDFRVRWSEIQAGFVDDPRHAVEDADRFVADVARAFTSGLESRRRTLTSAWERNEHGETEELRLTMRQYHALVDRILLG